MIMEIVDSTLSILETSDQPKRLVGHFRSVITPEPSTMGLLGGSVHDGEDTSSTLFRGYGVEVFQFGAHGSSCGPGHIGRNHSRAAALS